MNPNNDNVLSLNASHRDIVIEYCLHTNFVPICQKIKQIRNYFVRVLDTCNNVLRVGLSNTEQNITATGVRKCGIGLPEISRQITF